MVYLKSVKNVITLAKLIGLFARLVMGTIFLVSKLELSCKVQ